MWLLKEDRSSCMSIDMKKRDRDKRDVEKRDGEKRDGEKREYSSVCRIVRLYMTY
jgi:hypothetical protein